ncbi:Osmotin, thaumatin-like protein, partial [Auricularia subglabra TFB-10046 SS5]
NLCGVSVWPAVLTRLGTAPNGATGWEAAPRTSLSFTAEAGWMGRIWARTGCSFDGATTASQCETGGCDSGLLCSSAVSGTPASFMLPSTSQADRFAVSLVDGFNLPITTTSDEKCPPAVCVADVLADCPSELAIKKGQEIIACSSACRAGIGGNTANSTQCCTGSFNTPATCAASQVQFYDYFHTKCPNAYAYAYDDGTRDYL